MQSNNTYRKKQVVVEAFQMTKERREDNGDWPSWLHQAWQKDSHEEGALYPHENPYNRRLRIRTLEGEQLVEHDDYIIRGVEGEIYPCKPAIFEKTYERYTTE